jgi:hypothetical protein
VKANVAPPWPHKGNNVMTSCQKVHFTSSAAAVACKMNETI